MKAHDLAKLLQSYRELNGGPDSLRQLAEAFGRMPAATTALAAVAQMRAGASLAQETDPSGRIGSLAPDFRSISALVGTVGTAAAKTACAALVALAHDFPEFGLSSAVTVLAVKPKTKRPTKTKKPAIPRNPNAVQEYVREILATAPGLPAFGTVLAKLKADTVSVKAAEMRDIASKVGCAVGEDTTRAVAFKRIERDHKIITDMAAKTGNLRGTNAT